MKGISSQFHSRSRSGYALILGLFICVLIGVLFYYRSFLGTGIEINTGQKMKNPPWKQWHNLYKITVQNKLGKPFPIHPKITEKIGLKANLHKGNDERGFIGLVFDTNYTVEGNWAGEYSVGPNKAKEYQISLGKIRGSFVPYPDRINVKSPHKTDEIYFLAYGLYMLVEYNNAEGGKVRKVNGDIYITGWLAPDFTIQRGQAVITSDNKHYEAFDFEGKAEKIMDMDVLIKALRQQK
jgi:hypothetical protein